MAISNVFSFSNICSTLNINSAKRPFISLQVQGVTSSWLFDTGAAATVMALSEFCKISPDNRPKKLPAMLNLSTASADSLNIVGVYNLSFLIKGKTIQNPVYVFTNLNQKAIIGMDVIKKFGLVYSPLKETFHFEDTPINSPYFFQPKMPLNQSAVASLTVVKTIKIPPLTSISLSVSFLSSDYHFLPMTTNDSNTILFTKTIRDLAHIASLRIQYLANKVKYIDHLLPDDSTDLLGRQKRFITLTPWIICLDKLKAIKHSKLEFFFGLPIEPIVTVTMNLKHVKKTLPRFT